MRAWIDTTISHFRILEALAEGGRDGLFKAKDTRLGRLVAIRLVESDGTISSKRREQLFEELRAASHLNHPNIARIYEIGRESDVDFVAMEYVEGSTLADLIARRDLTFDKTMSYGMQLARALATAHAAGVSHGDLRPDKVMVNHTGLVKVLDFGLSALSERDQPQEGRAAERNTSTSPRMARGGTAGEERDICSFGLVLREMLTGGRQRDRAEGRAGAIRHGLERLLVRCLDQDPQKRFRLMEDIELVLGDLFEEYSAQSQPALERPPAPAPARRMPLALYLVAIVLGVGSILAWWLISSRQRKPEPRTSEKLYRLTKDTSLAITPALSADGKLLAYASDRASEAGLDIWVQQVAGGPPIRLTDDEAAEYAPTFSPDGSRILFRSDRGGGGLYVVPTLGGQANFLASGGRRPRFSPDGRLVAFYTGPQGSYSGTQLYVVPSVGGEPRRLQTEFVAAASPIWTPDGKHLLFVGTERTGNWDWWVVAIDGASLWPTGARKVFDRQGLSGGPPGPEAWLDGNRIAFTAAHGDGTNIWRVPIAPDSWKINAPAERITFGTGELQAHAGAGGRLVFTSGSNNIDIWGLSLEGDPAAVPLQRLTSSASGDYSCDISSDGKMLAFRSDRSYNIDVWSKDLETGVERALTLSPDFESLPKIKRDGSVVAYGVRNVAPSGGLSWAINVLPSGGGLPKEICRDCGPPMSWSSDGTKVLYVKQNASKAWLHLVDTVTGSDRKLAEHPEMAAINAARLSPDDRWIVCKGDLDMRRSVILAIPLHDWSAAPVKDWISLSEGRSWDDVPRWSSDGKVVYFISDRDGFRCIWARRLEPATKKPLGAPFAVRHFHQWRLSPVSNLAQIELAVARDKLVLPLQEQTGSIWMLESETEAPSR